MEPRPLDVVAQLRQARVGPGDQVALAVEPGVGAGITAPGTGGPGSCLLAEAWVDQVAAVEEQLHPRWVLWSSRTAQVLVAEGVRVARAWDVAAVHRLLQGGWRADPAVVWARLHDLPVETIPEVRAPDLFTAATDDDDDDEALRPDGHLHPGWVDGGWAATPERLARWAGLALEAASLQADRLRELPDPGHARSTAHAESAAELLCAELSHDGLPMDRGAAEEIIAGFVGPRPRDDAEATEQRARRDAEVLRHAGGGSRFDLRSPGQVRSLLRSVGIEAADTRAWRLEALRSAHPVVDALLAWRKAERVATTYGYGWLDEHLGADGRLRGSWTSADGAAGRMTASAGLHNMPTAMRRAVVAEPGHVFVRADLGQIEPRVLAAVSGDPLLARATLADDLYAPIATQLAVDRATAKVAVLGAMYGQTTGHGAGALRALRSAYPVAMAYLEEADAAAQGGHALRTYGGRVIPMGVANSNDVDDREARRQAAARGRYGRNALVQGAAAELFKVWAATVRAGAGALDARVVLCLHDELLVHVPSSAGPATAELLETCLQAAARRWTPGTGVRFVADVSVVRCWAEAKG